MSQWWGPLHAWKLPQMSHLLAECSWDVVVLSGHWRLCPYSVLLTFGGSHVASWGSPQCPGMGWVPAVQPHARGRWFEQVTSVLVSCNQREPRKERDLTSSPTPGTEMGEKSTTKRGNLGYKATQCLTCTKGPSGAVLVPGGGWGWWGSGGGGGGRGVPR